MATIRKNCHCSPEFRTEISDVCRPKSDYEDGTKEFGVSTVDLLLPNAEAFIRGASGCSINKHGLWEAVINELETTCVTKVERSTRNGTTETVYTVPIVGYRQVVPVVEEDDYLPGAYNGYGTENPTDGFGSLQKSMIKRIKRNPAKFAFWMGRYYDVRLLYLHQPERSSPFKALGNLYAPLPRLEHEATEFIKGVSYRTFRRANLPSRVRVCHDTVLYGQEGCNWQQADPLDYLEINLEHPRYVTHIGTAGGFPKLAVYSTRRVVGRRRTRAYIVDEVHDDAPLLSAKGNGIPRGKFSSSMYILKESEGELSWVTSYEVHYRHHVTHKWTLLVVAAGNSDALSEVVLDLSPHFNSREGLFTQALRIRPLTHRRRPLMRVSVYGRDPLSPSPTAGSGRYRRDTDIENRGHCVAPSEVESGDVVGASVGPVTVQDLPTIEYAVTTTRSKAERRHVRDGLQCSSRYFYYYEGNEKFQKKKSWQATIRDEADSYLYENELEY